MAMVYEITLYPRWLIPTPGALHVFLSNLHTTLSTWVYPLPSTYVPTYVWVQAHVGYICIRGMSMRTNITTPSLF